MKILFQHITDASDGAYPLPAANSNEKALIRQQRESEPRPVISSDEASNAIGITDAPSARITIGAVLLH